MRPPSIALFRSRSAAPHSAKRNPAAARRWCAPSASSVSQPWPRRLHRPAPVPTVAHFPKQVRSSFWHRSRHARDWGHGFRHAVISSKHAFRQSAFPHNGGHVVFRRQATRFTHRPSGASCVGRRHNKSGQQSPGRQVAPWGKHLGFAATEPTARTRPSAAPAMPSSSPRRAVRVPTTFATRSKRSASIDLSLSSVPDLWPLERTGDPARASRRSRRPLT
jgi:hypothetical protein